MKPLFDDRFTESDSQIINRKAKKLIGNYGYHNGDEDDIAQDLALHLVRRHAKFNPARGKRSTFVKHVSDKKIANLIEHQHAQRRDRRKECPLLDDAPEYVDRRAGTSFEKLPFVAEDVDSQLTSTQCEFLALRFQGYTIAEICELPGWTRAKARHCVAQIKSIFKKAGF